MGIFREVNRADLETILKGYGYGYVGHEPVLAGTVNTNIRVETDRGIRFLRVNEGKAEQDVAREAAIVAHLADRGIPTPAPEPTCEGTPYFTWANAFVSLFPWVPGRTLHRQLVTPAHAAHVGRVLAALHFAGQDFGDHHMGLYQYDAISSRLSTIIEKTAVDYASDVELCRATKRLETTWRGLGRIHPDGVPFGLIHQDLFIDNVLFAPDTTPDPTSVSALLDFEQACWGSFVYDVAVTLLAFGFGSDDFRPDVTRALLDAYAEVRRPLAIECETFSAALQAAACRFAITRITDVHFRRASGAPSGKDYRRYLLRLDKVLAPHNAELLRLHSTRDA